MKYIIFAGLFQAIVSLLLLVSSKKKERADTILSLLLGSIGWHLLTKFYIFTILETSSVSAMMHTHIQLAYGPLLYLYAEDRNNKLPTAGARWYLFIPLIMSIALYGSVIAAYHWYPANGQFMLDIYNKIVFIPIISTHFLCSLLVLLKINNRDCADYLLIRNICLVLLGLGAAELFLTYAVGKPPYYTSFSRSIIYILLAIVPVLIIRQKLVSAASAQHDLFPQPIPARLTASSLVQVSESPDLPSDSLPRKLLLESAQHANIFREIEGLVKDGQRYKEEDISLEKLAAISGIGRHHISETLNVFAKKTFYQYINEYRIAEVLKTLANNKENESLLAIAYKSGFKNKSSFNMYFKKIIGSTPSEYIKNRGKVYLPAQ